MDRKYFSEFNAKFTLKIMNNTHYNHEITKKLKIVKLKLLNGQNHVPQHSGKIDNRKIYYFKYDLFKNHINF